MSLRRHDRQHLIKPWMFVVSGHVVREMPRHLMIRGAVFRQSGASSGAVDGVLQLNEATVPAIYGRSADAKGF